MEDFDPFRLLINSLIKNAPSLHVICAVSDGLVAVDKAKELSPDLILMDVGLPGLNGIESARRIRKFLANSKIIFVSQETSIEVVREALTVGACGYVLKSRAGVDLLAAIEAVLDGKQYVSSGLDGQFSAEEEELPS